MKVKKFVKKFLDDKNFIAIVIGKNILWDGKIGNFWGVAKSFNNCKIINIKDQLHPVRDNTIIIEIGKKYLDKFCNKEQEKQNVSKKK